MKKFIPLLALLLLLVPVCQAGAANDAVQFNDTVKGWITVGSLDWNVGNALAYQAIPEGDFPACDGTVQPFTLYYQAKLQNFLDPDGNVIGGTGLNTDYEISVLIAFGELGCAFGPNAIFTFDPTNTTNYAKFYIDFTPETGSNLSGTGFDGADGVLIMEGVVAATDTTNSVVTGGNYAATLVGGTSKNVAQLDQFVANDYPGVGTVTGGGSSTVVVDIDENSLDGNYVRLAVQEPVNIELFSNSSQVTPYIQQNPSHLFWDEMVAAYITPTFGDCTGAPAFPCETNSFGTVNGSTKEGETVDFQFQADANSSLNVVTSEEVGKCRMTGGSVTVNVAVDEDGVEYPYYEWVPDTYAEYTVLNEHNGNGKGIGNLKNLYDYWVTTGGQIGAPSVDPATGHWEHTQHGGGEGNFTFLSGTASAPPGTEISNINCNDEGWCVQARCAPFKQIFWDGVGYFPSKHEGENFNAHFPTDCVTPGGPHKDGTLHYYRAMVGDFGENDRPTREESLVDDNPETCDWYARLQDAGYAGPPGPWVAPMAVFLGSEPYPDEPFQSKGGQLCDKCPDYYQIEIYCGPEPVSDNPRPPFYTFSGYINGGNFQIHPETSEKCTATPDLFPELFQ
jgi:hypothetical protein